MHTHCLSLLPEAGDQHQGLVTHRLELMVNPVNGDPVNLPHSQPGGQPIEGHQGVAEVGLGQVGGVRHCIKVVPWFLCHVGDLFVDVVEPLDTPS